MPPITSVELFAGGGGLALGIEKAAINCILLNENDKNACRTLRSNRPSWNLIEDDIRNVDFTSYIQKVDIVTGGFPCQSFSYAGKGMGMGDTRGTLFYEFSRAVGQLKPLICVGENVRGLLNHDTGKTLTAIIQTLDDIGYRAEYKVLNAINYNVPQKRERLVLVGVRKDTNINFEFPESFENRYTLKDALKAGELYENDVPKSKGVSYPCRKKEIMDFVPPGGCWRNLPEPIQKEYMKKSFYLGGGRTGMARRLSWDEASLTLTCSPAQNQTERCHPEETRPLTIREYARIQTFPDDWSFFGSIPQQYKQIGNAVPVNLAYEIGKSLINALK